MQNSTDGTSDSAATEAQSPTRPIRVGVVGGGSRAASLLRLLTELDGVIVSALLAENADGPGVVLADELGVFATCDPAVFCRGESCDVLVEASDGEPSIKGTATALGSGVEVIGSVACDLLLKLLSADAYGREQQELLQALERASERSRSQERRLEASKGALESTNARLQTELSELYFMHEFFKTLTRCASVDDVGSVVVDGINGVLGSEMSAAYIANSVDWTLRLHGSQGASAELFSEIVPVSETILGRAFSRGLVQESDIDPHSPSAAWIDPSAGVRSHAAVPLNAGDSVIGVLVAASSAPRELSVDEMQRLVTLGHEASLSLQNALLLSELERLAVTDRLTQLYNHGHFHQRLEEEISRSGRFGRRISLLMIDIDDFKAFNDSYGHPRGDDALRAVSAVIRGNLRDMDVAARYGGEEFVVLLPETTLQGAHLVAERIRAGVEAAGVLTLGDEVARCTVSSGVATFPDQAATAARLVEAADCALYNAKRAGKNRVEPGLQ